jgi:prolyl-tRNA editing enzyme YbaK/EbsC (Cys-tRNA(Pro) deacylase)
LQPLTPQDVQAALDRLGTGIQIRFFDDSTATSQMAADNIGCEVGQIVKTLAFMVNGEPIVILASGDQYIDDRKLAAMFEVGRKKIKIATPEQCVEIYGYEPGGVPPVAHRTPNLPMYLDDSLQRYNQVYAAGGAHNTIFPISLSQLIDITGCQIADVKRS